MSPSLKLFALVVVTVPVALRAQSVTWTIDPAHSVATFTVRHMLVANVRGEFAGPTGTVSYDPANIARTLKVAATIDARTVNTRNADRDTDLRGDQFFAVAKYPAITFTSTRAEAGAAGHIAVTGDLVMRGIRREVVLDVEGPSPAVKDLDGRMREGATMTTVLSRRAFGLLYNELLEAGGAVVGDEVRVTVDLEVVHKE